MIIVNGYIVAVEKRDASYQNLLEIIQNKPSDPEGYQYKLRYDTLEWELVEVPPMPDEPITEDEALTRYTNELTGGNAEDIQEATETLIKIVKEVK